jgi:outer membrane protein assembly factor BamB
MGGMPFLFALTATLIYITPALAQKVKAAPDSGHPTAAITVSGSKFGDLEAIDVYVDTVDTLLLVSNATGSFSGSVTIPVTAGPGTHYVTAVGRKSGDAAQVAFTVTTPWAEVGFGAAGLRWNPYENTVNTGNVPYLGSVWQVPTVAVDSSPAVVSGRVYVATYGGQGVESLVASTGAVMWSTLPSVRFASSPAVVDGVVYVGAYTAQAMYALNATTGAIIWGTGTGSNFQAASPVVVNGVVYAGCQDGKVYAFEASTGTILWTYQTGSFVYSSPAVVDGVVYVGSADDNVYALNATTGALIWKYATGNSIYGSPAVANGIVYIGSDDASVYAIHAISGTKLWSYVTGGGVESSPAVAGGTVYVSSSDGNTYALDAHTGAVLWSVATNEGDFGSSPAVANGVVYVGGSDGTLYALDPYGDILWTGDVGGAVYSTPVISDGAVYVNSFNDVSDTGFTSVFAPDAGANALRVNALPPPLSSLHPDMSLSISR